MSYFSLHGLPAELRLLIYHACLADQWDGQMPALIIALRGDSQLYHEALEVFYATNTLLISSSTEKRLSLALPEVLKTVQRATLFYSMRLLSPVSWEWGVVPYSASYPLWNMRNLESLTLTTDHHMVGDWISYLFRFIRDCIIHFPRLRHLGVKVPKSYGSITDTGVPDLQSLKSVFLGEISLATEIPVLGPRSLCNVLEYWEWDAGKNRRLLWTDHQYTWSVPWKNVGVVYQHLTNRHRQVFWRSYGTTYAGLMCRHIFPLCRKSCSCTKAAPPPFLCTEFGHVCCVAPHGLDSFNSYIFKRA